MGTVTAGEGGRKRRVADNHRKEGRTFGLIGTSNPVPDVLALKESRVFKPLFQLVFVLNSHCYVAPSQLRMIDPYQSSLCLFHRKYVATLTAYFKLKLGILTEKSLHKMTKLHYSRSNDSFQL
jgi:hypothetical protein